MILMLALLTLPYLPIVRWQLRLWLRPAFQTGHPFVPFPTMLTTLLWAFGRGVQGRGSLWSLLPFVFLLLSGLALRLRRANRALDGTVVSWPPATGSTDPIVAPSALLTRLCLVVWLIVPALALFLVSLSKPLFTDRYLIWIAPAFYLLVAAGLAAVRQRWSLVSAALLAVVLAFNLQAVWGQSHTVIKSDFRSAAAYIGERRTHGDLLLFLIPYVRHTYEYYADDTAPWTDAPFTNAGASEEDVDTALTDATRDHRAVWLVSSEPELWDSSGRVLSWLQAHGALTDQARFVRVQVARYALSRP
jgi:hypothetical protein